MYRFTTSFFGAGGYQVINDRSDTSRDTNDAGTVSEARERLSTALTINAGSSSLRLGGYALQSPPERLAELRLAPPPDNGPSVLAEFIRQHARVAPDLVMHRVVHGGRNLRQPCLIDRKVETEIERLKDWAPLHNATALAWIHASREAFGADFPQAACFDTGFYANLPAVASSYALPKEFNEEYEVRRYGFHGLAHQSMLNQWHDQKSEHTAGRVISLQLGAGCSVTATKRGQPIETSMGFSPLEGLVMATRSGDLDPAIVLYLIEQCGFSAGELDRILNQSSGLRGISGESADMQSLLRSKTEAAALAVDMFCHRARKYLGAYLAALGGAEAILFGGGIGENAAVIRARILEDFDWAQIRLDPARNDSIDPGCGGPIHAENSAVELWVTPTDEELVMAKAARALLTADAPQS